MCYLVAPGVPVSAAASSTESVRVVVSSTSARIIVAALGLLFCYYAAGVVITILLSVLLAYFLDPVVELIERVRISRSLASLLVVILFVSMLVGVGYSLWGRALSFADDWPRYSAVLKKGATAVETRIERIAGRRRSEEHTSELQSPCNLVCRLLLEKKKKNKVVSQTHSIYRDSRMCVC